MSKVSRNHVALPKITLSSEFLNVSRAYSKFFPKRIGLPTCFFLIYIVTTPLHHHHHPCHALRCAALLCAICSSICFRLSSMSSGVSITRGLFRHACFVFCE